MNKIKKTIAVFLTAAFIITFTSVAFTDRGDRGDILKIYNWGEYLADGTDGSADIIADFEKWYTEVTGKSIRVEYSQFDTNETMFTQINHKKADYDLVCPSDYMVQKMTTNNLLKVINDEEFEEIWAEAFEEEAPELYGLNETDDITVRNIMNPMLTYLISGYDEGWSAADGEIYSLPYIWGTFGIMYDKSKAEDIGGSSAGEDMQSWEALFGEKYSKKIYMKDSVRDAFGCANIYNATAELEALSSGWTDYSNEDYKIVLADCLNYPNDEKISAAEATLKAQKKHLYAYEGDDGKEDLLSGKSSAALGLF